MAARKIEKAVNPHPTLSQAEMGKSEKAVEVGRESVSVETEHMEPIAGVDYHLASWGGYPQWRCQACAFDTLEGEEVIRAHWMADHAPRPKPKFVNMAEEA